MDVPPLVHALLIATTLGVLLFGALVARIVLIDGPRLEREWQERSTLMHDSTPQRINEPTPRCGLCDQPAVSQRASCVDDVWREIWLCRQHRHEAFELDETWNRLWSEQS